MESLQPKTRSVYNKAQDKKSARTVAVPSLDLCHTRPIIDRLIGDSPSMQLLKAAIIRVAGTRSTVLITGESGTGKELAARTIHDLSDRAKEPFVAVNCGALSESLLEAELFGFVKGAFTGAMVNKRGLFLAAHKGTIFLDEFGEMSSAMQVRLLRVLQERKVRPVGAHSENDEINVDVRILVATNKNLEHEFKENRFRQDLYFRVNVQTIHLPPLRERTGDFPALIRFLLNKVHSNVGLGAPVTIDRAAVWVLQDYSWPGNVRELESKLEKLSTLVGSAGIITADLAHSVLDGFKVTVHENGDIEYHGILRSNETLQQSFDRQLLQMFYHLRKRENGNLASVARKLGMKRTALHMRIGSLEKRLKAL